MKFCLGIYADILLQIYTVKYKYKYILFINEYSQIYLIVLIDKQLISRQKMHEELISFDLFCHKLQTMFNMERAIAHTELMTFRFRRKWEYFINITGALIL